MTAPRADTVILGGTVVTADGVYEADVAISDGTIVAVEQGIRAHDADVICARGHLVLPGAVDPHVHLEAGTQGQRTADDFMTGTRAAALGGTTTIIDFCYQEPGRPLLDGLLVRRAAAEKRAVVDFSFHFVVTRLDAGNVTELDDVCAAGVTSFKVYMAYPKRGLMADDATLYRLFERAGQLGALPVVHAENGVLNEGLIEDARSSGSTGPGRQPDTHPTASEAEGTHRALAIAEMAGTRVYFVHVSCAEALDEIQSFRRRGLTPLAETCPHYLLLDDSLYGLPGFEAAKYVMNPPLRDARNHDILWAALAANEIQTVATDHCPFDFCGQKDRGFEDFSLIPNGVPGIEHRVSLLFEEGVRAGRLSMERWIDAVATAPARIFGLERKGRVAVGSDADLIIFDPEHKTVIRQRDHHMSVDYSAYEGRTVHGWARTVLSRGEVIVDNGSFVGRPGRGMFQPRSLETSS